MLAVYAAGYWRTRDAARGIDAQAQQRRPVHTESRQPPAMPPAAPDPVSLVAPLVPPASAATLPPVIPPSAQPTTPPANEPAAAKPPAEPVLVAAIAAVTAAPPEELSPAPLPAAEPEAITRAQAEPEPPTEPYWRDGTFTGWGTSRHGDIKAQVVIREGRIVESSIVSCETRYPCDVISTIIPQPVQWQSPEVDRVSRATESADAYYYALVNALAEALVEPALTAAAPPR